MAINKLRFFIAKIKNKNQRRSFWRLCNCRPGWAERSSVNYKSAIWYFPSRLRSKLSRKTRAEIGLKIHEPVRNSCGLRNFHSVFGCCAASLHFKMSARQKDFSTHTHIYECIRQYYLWIVEFFHAVQCSTAHLAITSRSRRGRGQTLLFDLLLTDGLANLSV